MVYSVQKVHLAVSNSVLITKYNRVKKPFILKVYYLTISENVLKAF
jgi:hypothetical protein